MASYYPDVYSAPRKKRSYSAPRKKGVMDWFQEQSPLVQAIVIYGTYKVVTNRILPLLGPGGIAPPITPGSGTGGYSQPNFYNYGVDQQQQTDAGMKPTYPAGQYSIFADALYSAFEYSGTDNDGVQAVFSKLKNDADVTALINAWGVRAISTLGWADDYTLPQIVVSEMPRSDIEKYVNTPLAKAGISYRF